MQDAYGTFHREFEVVPATTPTLTKQAHAMRYQVYCVENPYEDKGAHREGMERDEYDTRSVHTLVRHRRSGCFAGVVRLVLPDEQNPDAPFPVEAHCGHGFDRAVHDPRRLPRRHVAEVSRFAVSKEFKRRMGESGSIAGISENATYEDRRLGGAQARRYLSHITLGLIAGLVQMSVEHHITHWYAVMEPALLRLLTRTGIHFRPLGPLVDYHGKRQPGIAALDELLTTVQRERPDVWEVITDCGRDGPLSPVTVPPAVPRPVLPLIPVYTATRATARPAPMTGGSRAFAWAIKRFSSVLLRRGAHNLQVFPPAPQESSPQATPPNLD